MIYLLSKVIRSTIKASSKIIHYSTYRTSSLHQSILCFQIPQKLWRLKLFVKNWSPFLQKKHL